MTEQAQAAPPRATAQARPSQTALWRVAGSLLIAHVILMLAGFAMQKVSPLSALPEELHGDLAGHALNSTYLGMYLALFGFGALLLGATLLARLLRTPGELAGWLSSAAASVAVVYIAVTIGTAFAGATAATFAAHGQSEDATVINALHWFSVSSATGALGLFTLLVGSLIWSSRLLPRWLAGFAAMSGILCLIGAFPAIGPLNDTASLVWMIWCAALGAGCLRRRRSELPAVVMD